VKGDLLVLSESVIAEIRCRASTGESVNSIKEDLDVPKSTVYYHFRKEVGQKQKSNQVKIPDDLGFHGELCGIFAGDGSFQYTKSGNYKIKFHLNSEEKYWEKLREHLEIKLEKKPFICDSEESKISLLYNSKKLYELFDKNLDWEDNKAYTIRLHDRNFSQDFKVGFARGLMDTDGYRRPDHKRYVFTSASESLRDNLYDILYGLDIGSQRFEEEPGETGNAVKHKLRITGSDVDKFSNRINPRKPKRKY